MRSGVIKAIVLAAVVWWCHPAAATGGNDAGIVWYTPEEAESGAIVYEEPLPAPTAAAESSNPFCALADSPFALAWLAMGSQKKNSKPRIVVVIDDMGVDKARSARMARLPHRLTLAFLPYAHNVQKQVAGAAALGHEIMMHVPMQPEDMTIDPGPHVLRADIAPDELRARILANLDAFDGYAGINNHMGSKFTQDRAALDVLMAELARRDVFFLDSKTHPRSVALSAAVTAGVAAAGRDVFIDHVATPEGVRRALAEVERYARQHGSAIAIGHPKDATIDGLAGWLPTLQQRGFEVVTLADLLRSRHADVLQAVSHTPQSGGVRP